MTAESEVIRAESAKTPTRTCVVCRRKAAKDDLLRFVLRPAAEGGQKRLLLDALQDEPGRGAYCCGELRCLEHRQLERILLLSFGSSSGSLGRRELRRKRRAGSGSSDTASNNGEPNFGLRALEAVLQTKPTEKKTGAKKKTTRTHRKLASLLEKGRAGARTPPSEARSKRIRL